MTRILSTVAAAALTLSMTGAAMAIDVDDEGGMSAEQFKANLAESGTFSSLDADGSGSLNEEEFGAITTSEESSVQPDMASYDADGNGEVSEEEFANGTWAAYDADQDDYINADEFSTMNNDAIFGPPEN